MGLLSNQVNESLLSMLGPLFTWKFLLLVSFMVACVFIYRCFCRFFCPLGALYGLFNKISFVGVKVETSKCTDCGICTGKCKMDIKHVGDHECISCGECISACPTKAIQWKGSKWTLPENEIGDSSGMSPEEIAAAEAALEAKNARIAKRNKAVKITAGVAMAALLVGALVYYNYDYVAEALFGEEETLPATLDEETQAEPLGTEDTSDSSDATQAEPLPEVGVNEGNLCYPMDIELFGEDGSLGNEVFNAGELSGDQITVLNFWFTTCGPCLEELPDFERIAGEYADTVDVIAIHSQTRVDVPAWLAENYPDSAMKFGYDADNAYYDKLISVGTYPATVVLDEDGVIIAKFVRKVHYDELKAIIDEALSD